MLFSVLIYLGLEGLRGNAVVARAAALLRAGGGGGGGAPPAERALGALQLFCVAAIYGVTLTPAGMVFPALICALVPLRLAVMPPLFAWAFGEGALELADPRAWQSAAAAGDAAAAAAAAAAATDGSGASCARAPKEDTQETRDAIIALPPAAATSEAAPAAS